MVMMTAVIGMDRSAQRSRDDHDGVAASSSSRWRRGVRSDDGGVAATSMTTDDRLFCDDDFAAALAGLRGARKAAWQRGRPHLERSCSGGSGHCDFER
ncbi:hypothetical protein Dimus_008045 [Dionaea muscipula]